MGEYIQNGPMDGQVDTAAVKAFLSAISGYPVEALTGRAMFLMDVAVDDPEKPGEKMQGIAYGGNQDTVGMLQMCFEAMHTLRYALVNQAIADSVPDDISGIQAA